MLMHLGKVSIPVRKVMNAYLAAKIKPYTYVSIPVRKVMNTFPP